MKKQIIIVGTGAVAAEITSSIEDTPFGEIAGVEIKGYLEYSQNIDIYYKRYGFIKPVIGDLDTYQPTEGDYFVLGVANVDFRRRIIAMLESRNAQFITLINHTAMVARTAKIGRGNVINPMCMIGPNVELGDFNILTSGSIISHDSKVGDNNAFSTALLCGHVVVGNDNNFGIRGTVIPHVTIGSRNTIQAGMIVDKDVADDSTIFHRFKEKVIAIPKYD